MRRFACYLPICLLCLAGCRREDWQSVEVALPQGVTEARAAETLAALDRVTPPRVTRRGDTLRIRYNSMRVSPGNFVYALGECAVEGKGGAL